MPEVYDPSRLGGKAWNIHSYILDRGHQDPSDSFQLRLEYHPVTQRQAGVFTSWTWGLKSCVKSFAETDLRRLVLTPEVVALMGSKGFSPSNQLLGGSESYDAGGLMTSYFRRVRILKPIDSLNASGPGRRSPTRAEKIAALEAELARLKEDAAVGVTEPIVDIKNAIVELSALATEEAKEREQEKGVVRGVVKEQK